MKKKARKMTNPPSTTTSDLNGMKSVETQTANTTMTTEASPL
jgi:hypothetical protein